MELIYIIIVDSIVSLNGIGKKIVFSHGFASVNTLQLLISMIATFREFHVHLLTFSFDVSASPTAAGRSVPARLGKGQGANKLGTI